MCWNALEVRSTSAELNPLTFIRTSFIFPVECIEQAVIYCSIYTIISDMFESPTLSAFDEEMWRYINYLPIYTVHPEVLQ